MGGRQASSAPLASRASPAAWRWDSGSWAAPSPWDPADRVSGWMTGVCATCLSRTAESGTSRPPVCTRGAQRRLPREARDGHDASPGHLHRWFTSFLVLQGHYTGGDRNAKSQPHAGPCCCPESDKRTSRGSQPVRGGVGATSGARPETAGGVGELQGGPERPAAHGHPTPALSSKLAARGGWPHRCANTPPSHRGDGVASAFGDKRRLFLTRWDDVSP